MVFNTFGGDKRDRTADLLNAIQALSQLSYTPIFGLLSDSFCIITCLRKMSIPFFKKYRHPGYRMPNLIFAEEAYQANDQNSCHEVLPSPTVAAIANSREPCPGSPQIPNVQTWKAKPIWLPVDSLWVIYPHIYLFLTKRQLFSTGEQFFFDKPFCSCYNATTFYL